MTGRAAPWCTCVPMYPVDTLGKHSSRCLERAAKGPLPRDRVRVPAIGERCPRHHGIVSASALAKPCLLCRPDLVPVKHGGDAITDRKDAAIVGNSCHLPARCR